MDAVVVELGKCNEYLPLYVFCTWLSMYSATAVRGTKVTNVRLNRAPLVFIREEKIGENFVCCVLLWRCFLLANSWHYIRRETIKNICTPKKMSAHLRRMTIYEPSSECPYVLESLCAILFLKPIFVPPLWLYDIVTRKRSASGSSDRWPESLFFFHQKIGFKREVLNCVWERRSRLSSSSMSRLLGSFL